MGRDGGGNVYVFKTQDEMEAFLTKEKEDNTRNYKNYKCDTSDSGRGYACEDNGGFASFKIIRKDDQNPFKTREEAEEELEKIAQNADRGNDSKVLVVGRFYPMNYNTEGKLLLMKQELIRKKKELSQSPSGTFKLVKLETDTGEQFAQCYECKSINNISKKRTRTGVCGVCGPYDAAWNETWNLPKTLYGPEYQEEIARRETHIQQEEESFKKAKTDLENASVNEQPTWIVVETWTGAHY